MFINNCDDIKPNDYLYHYTSLETLALILKNRTIRFNSLLNVDDLQEKESRNSKTVGQHCYVSCWTRGEKESIPMWKMYGDGGKGVRIGLPRDPFEIIKNQKYIDGKSIVKESYFSFSDMLEKGYYVLNSKEPLSMLTKVEYKDDKNLLFPDTETNTSECVSRNIKGMGVYKNTNWSFQNEYRYMFYATSFPFGEKFTSAALKELENNIRNDVVFAPFDHLDLNLSDEAFEKMKIILGPNCSEEDKEIVSSLVNKYNKPAKVTKSEFTGIIR